MISLSTYEYEPIQGTAPESSPAFPMDDTAKDWPATVDDGGTTAFTAWEETTDWLDAFIGFFMDLFGPFFMVFMVIIIAIVGVVIFVLGGKLLQLVKGDSTERSMKKMQEMMMKQIELQRMQNLAQQQKTISHIGAATEKGKALLKAPRLIVYTNLLMNFVLLAFALVILI